MQTFSPQAEKVFQALCEAQKVIRGAFKDCVNPFHKSNYADLESVSNACKDHLNANGIAVFQSFETVEGNPHLVTTLGHTSGQWIKSYLKLPFPCEVIDKNGQITRKSDPQALGAAITYCRRFALAAIAGVVQTDDDAESAMGRGPQTQGTAQSQGASKPPIKPVEQTKQPKGAEDKVTPFDSPKELLREFCAANGADPKRLMEFIAHRAITKKVADEKVVESATSSKIMMGKFVEVYKTWLTGGPIEQTA